MADTEEEYLTHDETEAERTRRKANKRKAMSRLNDELRRQADDEAQAVRELNRSADNSRAKHSASRRAKTRNHTGSTHPGSRN